MRKRVLASVCGAATVVPAVSIAAGPDAHPGVEAAPSAAVADLSVRIYAARQFDLYVTFARRRRAAELRRRERSGHENARSVPAVLQTIAACESGGDPTSATGQFRGKYQFDAQTWRSVGGTGDPAAASSGEQDQRAAVLYAREGTTPWPVCGRGR